MSSEKSGDVTDEKRDDHSLKRPLGNETSIHSANDWESADLGDEGRKSKFLRLMGASKKEHHGRFVIGEKNAAAVAVHGRSEEDAKKLTSELEEQYRQGVELKLSGGARRHTGFGFHDEQGNGRSTAESAAADGVATVATDADSNSRAGCDSVEPSPRENDKAVKKDDDTGREGPKESDSDADKKSLSGFVQSSDTS